MSEQPDELGELASQSNPQMGQRLRAARESKGMSLRELARRVSVSPSFISQVELGRAAPSVGTLYAVVNELGLSLDSLMSGGHGHRADTTVRPLASPGHTFKDRAARADTLVPTGLSVKPLPEVGHLPGLLRADERPELYMRGVRWERLTPKDDPVVEFLRVTYPAGTESCPPDALMNHGGREYIHILEGRLEVQVAFARQIVEPGDSLNFDSTTPHRLSNPFAEACVALWFVMQRNRS